MVVFGGIGRPAEGEGMEAPRARTLDADRALLGANATTAA
jgi:hypothetical protein